ncbi:MAG: DUF192 domain-containing protein [Deltaproteobacteria bacterium]|jgi:uncharacterized membrane protein (UPF0127 family)|nr:DUF192 domain-containing protein [Deltaproteobacteria bacterium]
MSRRSVQIKFREKIIVAAALVADNFWLRLSGYMFRKKPHVSGILFESCGSIQTSFMNFDLDIVFLTKTNSVSKIQRNVKPWRFVFSTLNSKKVLELPAGGLPSDLKIGDVLGITPV